MNRALLCRPFPPDAIRERPGSRGTTVAYVTVDAVIDRLNEGLAGVWTFEVVRHDVTEREVVVLGRLTAAGTSKMAFGGSSITVDENGRTVSVADDLKAASSDALKKAASLLGVGVEFYRGSQTKSDGVRPSTADAKDRITARQLGALSSLCRQLGLGKDALCALLEKKYRRSAPQFLTKAEASSVLDELGQRTRSPSR